MPHQQPMHEVCGCGMPGLSLPGAKNSLQHGQDSASLCDENWAGVCSQIIGLALVPRGTLGVAGPQTVIYGEI